MQILSSFAAVKNCLTGSIPETICQSVVLRSLALDGLHSADRCNSIIYGDLDSTVFGHGIISQSSYMAKSPISGTIPICLFQMPVLQLLHLSGNGIKDTLSNVIDPVTGACNVARYLVDLSLSNNALRGSIPSCLQDHHWQNFDLSFNFFNGDLSPVLNANTEPVIGDDDYHGQDAAVANTSSLSLFVNRLSGTVPSSIIALQTVDVLKGNIFSCDYNHYGQNEGLPSHDESVKSYSCGSNAVNASLYVFVGALAVLLITITVSVVWQRQRTPIPVLTSSYNSLGSRKPGYWSRWCGECGAWMGVCREWYMSWSGEVFLLKMSFAESDQPSIDTNYTLQFLQLNQHLRRLAVLLTSFIVLVLMSTYAGLSLHFSTYTHKYSYSLGLMYLTGASPAITLLVLLVVFYALIKIVLSMGIAASSVKNADRSHFLFRGWRAWSPCRSSAVSWLSFTCNWLLPNLLLFSLNALVTLTVNMSYVYSETLDSLSDSSVLAIALAVSLFKVGWNNVVILNWMPAYLHYFKRRTLSKLRLFELLASKKKSHGTTHPAQTVSADESLGTDLLAEQHLQEAEPETATEDVRADTVLEDDEEYEAPHEVQHRYNRQILVILLMISIFTNVLAPYISSFFINPNCFYYTVSTMEPISSSYSFPQCYRFDASSGNVGCTGYVSVTRQMSFIPPFIYNYQCSSSLIQSFNAVYIYRYVISGIVLPLMLVIGCAAHKWLKGKIVEGNLEGMQRVWAVLFAALNAGLPLGWRLWSMVQVVESSACNDVNRPRDSGERRGNGGSVVESSGSISLKLTLSDQRPSAVQDALEVKDSPINMLTDNPLVGTNIIGGENGSIGNASSLRSGSVFGESFRTGDQASLQMEMEKQFATANTHQDLVQLFSRETYVLRLAGEFSVLLTFGVVFPPLGIVVCLAILSQTLMSQRLVSRLLMGSQTKVDDWESANRKSRSTEVAKPPVTKHDLLFILFPAHFARENAEMREFISLAVPYISFLMMLFLSFSLFDTMADSNGNNAGFVMMACLAAIPIMEYVVQSFR